MKAFKSPWKGKGYAGKRHLYEPLSFDNHEIRLITLLPFKNPWDRIQCTVQRVSLRRRSVSYKALSYAWGDPSVTMPISINGIEVPVTCNLKSALQHLRSPVDGVALWIDALSINQHDVTEKNQQIPNMGHIYALAEEVLVWLGQEEDDSNLAMDLIRDWGSACLRCVSPGSRLEDVDIGSILCRLPDPFNDRAWQALRTLFDRAWWHRRWVVQEFVMGKEVSFQCGRKVIDWMILYAASFVAWNHKDLPKLITESQHMLITDSRMDSFNVGVTRYGRISANLEPSMRYLLEKFYTHNTNDPRDRIYAFMGLAKDAHLFPPADYNKPPSEVFTEFARTFIERYQDLSILENAGISESRDSRSMNRPSWVPEWGLNTYFNVEKGLSTHDSARGLSATPLFSPDSRILSPLGVIFDKVDTFVPPEFFPKGSWEDLVLGTREATYPTGIPQLQAFFRLIMFNKDFHGKRFTVDSPSFFDLAAGFFFFIGQPHSESLSSAHQAAIPIVPSIGLPPSPGTPAKNERNPEDVPDYYLWFIAWFVGLKLSWLKPSTRQSYEPWLAAYRNDQSIQIGLRLFTGDCIQWPQETNMARGRQYYPQVLRSIANRIFERSLVRTEKGYMAIMPAHIREGDLICVLLGSRVPLILRKTESDYVLIGSCFVLGIMDGEAMQEVLRGKLSIQQFSIR